MTIVYLKDYRWPTQVDGTRSFAESAEAAGTLRSCARMQAEIRERLRQAALLHDRCMSACDLRDLDEMVRTRDAIREEMQGMGKLGE